MAKLQLNPSLQSVRGALHGFVYKHYKDKRGQVLSRLPDMRKVKPSPAQLAQRKAMKAAGEFHRQVLADPVLLKQYQKIAQRQRINLSAATIGASLRASAAGRRREA